jgi:putative transposase
MPPRTRRTANDRLRFIARLPEGEKMAPLCCEFGISRVAGEKITSATRPAASSSISGRL